MNKKTEKNNQAKTGNSDHDITVKKRGRPKGSKNKSIRTDREGLVKPDESNSIFIRYSLALSNLPKIDVNNPEQVKNRVNEYFMISDSYGIKASVASLALAFRVDRTTLFLWLTRKTETIKNQEAFNTIKNAYDIICNQYEYMMNSGKINPVAGIFLMKNNFGYRDQTEYTITANQEKEENTQDIVSRAGLLTD